jgi:hypothetical protein
MIGGPALGALGVVIDHVIGEPLHHDVEKRPCAGIAERGERKSTRGGGGEGREL